jgi:conserved oligomeric Golgi complex subunit 6
MSEVDAQGPVDIAPLQGTVSESVDTFSHAEPEAPHGEHEVPKLGEFAEETHVDETAAPAQENGDSKTNGMEPPQSDDLLTVEDATSSTAEVKREDPAPIPDSGKPKVPMSVKPTGSKAAGPPTPLVKKVRPSGQFAPSP